MKAITKMLTLAIFLFIGFSTQLSADSVKTYYFNGMNTKLKDARKELRVIKKAVKESGYRNYAKNFNPVLVYTETFGKIPDALRIKSLRYKIAMYLSDPKKYTTQYRRCTYTHGCQVASASQLDFVRITKQLIDDGALKDNSASVDGKPYFPTSSKIQFISYSRGNIFANMMQENYYGRKVKRTNIASAGYHKFGNLFTSTIDMVIGTYTLRERNLNPNYYYAISDYLKSKYNSNSKIYINHGKKSTRKALNEYIFYDINSYKDKNLDSARSGHNLANCYLNYWGLRDKIVYDIVLNYYRLGGK